MAGTAFDVTYDGPRLQTGEMPVRDLAPALLALGEVFTEASLLLHPGREPVALNIRATEDGSFIVQLVLVADWDQVADLLTSDPVQSLINLKELVVGGSVGLFWLLKKLKHRKITRIEDGAVADLQPGHVRLTLDDGTVLEVPSEVVTLQNSITIRRHVREVVEPLSKPGLDVVRFKSAESETSVEIRADDLDAYRVPERVEQPIGENRLEMILSIASLAFTEGNKWRLSDGDRTFYAALEDKTFLSRIEDGEPFRKGDMLRCDLRIAQFMTDEGPKTEYIVDEVLEHIPRGEQLRLDEGTPDPGDPTA